MDVLTAILACSLYRDDALVHAIAESNSHGNRYAVVDASLAADTGAPRPTPRSLETAIALASNVASLGGDPLLGFMQVPTAWASIYGKELGDLFNPCTNIAIGTTKLSDLGYECWRAESLAARRRNRTPPRAVETSRQRRACIIRAYALAIRLPEFEIVVHLELEHQRTAQIVNSIPADSPILFETRLGGRDRLLFEPSKNNDALIDPFATDFDRTRTDRPMIRREDVARVAADRLSAGEHHDQ